MIRSWIPPLALAALCLSGPATAVPAPSIDGELQDMIDFAGSVDPSNGCGLVEQDPFKDVRIFDSKIIPCVPVVDEYFPNAFDQVLDVLVYERGPQILYLGMRVAGAIGDLDGNGNADTNCPEANPRDEVGIGPEDLYRWSIDLDCGGGAELIVQIRDNTLTVSGAPYASASFAYHGAELEVAIAGLELPSSFTVHALSGNQFDGMGEDGHLFACSGPPTCVALEPACPPAAACAGTNVSIAGSARNCSSAPEMIVVSFGEESRVLGLVQPGEALAYGFDGIMPSCDSGGSTTFLVRATTGACGTGIAESACVVACEACRPVSCRVSGGACANDDGAGPGRVRHTFGGELGPCPSPPPPPGGALWTHVTRDGRAVVFEFRANEGCIRECEELSDPTCEHGSGAVRVEFGGYGLYRVSPGDVERLCSFTASIVDRPGGACGESGRDEYGISVVDLATQQTVFELEPRSIECGNLHVREPHSLVGARIEVRPAVGESESWAVLDGAYPNPFAASMSFGYQVPSGDAQNVEIGIYNVAGRLITRLASEVQSAGRYTVRWDGRDATGRQMAPGVYFLKSKVGSTQTVSRLLKVAE